MALTLRISSLRSFLLVSILSVILLAGLLAAWANYRDTAEQVEELFDAEMAQMARTLHALLIRQSDRSLPLTYEEPPLNIGEDDDDTEYTELGHKYEKKLAFEVWRQDGTLLIQTPTAQENRLPRLNPGFHDVELNGRVWRVFTLHDARGGLWIQVAQRDDVRSELVLEIASHAIIPVVIGLPPIAVLIILLVRLGLKPLDALSRDLRRRSYAHLDPLDETGLPRELRPLVAALNDLLLRVREHAERERQVSANIAHELRTPLAGLRIQLENARRLMEAERGQGMLDKAIAALDRMHHMVEQLLLLARLDASASLEQPEEIALDTLLKSLLTEIQPLVQQHRQQIVVEGDPAGVVWSGHAHLLFVLLRNLLDNALHYSPEGSTISIRITGQGLEILDEGPGVSEDQLERLTERFYRAGGDQDTRPGAGIGLAIAREIVRLHGLRIRFRNRTDRSGLRVILERS